jgi:hypothetical protein
LVVGPSPGLYHNDNPTQLQVNTTKAGKNYKEERIRKLENSFEDQREASLLIFNNILSI